MVLIWPWTSHVDGNQEKADEGTSRFHDHQMITSRKDVLGTELLSLPFRKEELEAILEDLVT